MSTTHSVVPDVLTPLRGLWRRFIPAAAPSKMMHTNADSSHCVFTLISIANHTHFTGSELPNTPNSSHHKPLRIVRVLEEGQTPAHVGRMLISGRMADVCAELDRLVARELALH